MDETGKLLRCGLARKNNDLPSVAHAQSRCDGFLELKLDALGKPLPSTVQKRPRGYRRAKTTY